MPMRIQLSRKKGWRMPANTVNVARPSKWGNPHWIGGCDLCGAIHTRAEAVAEFRAEIEASPKLQRKIREELAGKNLACWCKPGETCHGDVLLEMANGQMTTRPSSDTFLEMAAELVDPVEWVALQMTKAALKPNMTRGEAMDMVKAIVREGFEMLKRKEERNAPCSAGATRRTDTSQMESGSDAFAEG